MPPLLLGHRGARAFRQIPENTLASFERCLQDGCDGFEFDVRLSGDLQAVICHDAAASRLSIAKTAARKLALPSLAQVLQQFAPRAFLDIELKVAGLEAITLAGLRDYPPLKGCVVSSFLPVVLTTMHSLNPAIPLGFICETVTQLRGWRESPAEWVIPHIDLADGNLIKVLHEARKKVMVWTVNRSDRMTAFSEWGADAIISDETGVLVRSLRSIG